MSEPARVDFAALPASVGFRLDRRFVTVEDVPPPEPQPAPEDTAATAYAEGFAAGMAQAHQEAAERDRVRMLAELRREVGRLVVQTTATVTGKILTAEDHRRLAEETASQLAV